MLVFRDSQSASHISYIPGDTVGSGSAPDLLEKSWRFNVKSSGVRYDLRASIREKLGFEVGEVDGCPVSADSPISRGLGEAAAVVGGVGVNGTACPSAISGRGREKTGPSFSFLPPVRRFVGGKVTVYPGGRVSRLHVDRDSLDRFEAPTLRENVKRGEIQGFSGKSRNRLLDLIAKINRERVEVEQWRFVTLTYHNQKITARESKRHLKALYKRARRHFGPVAVLWKLEPHPGGKEQPHYHLLVMLPSAWTKDLRAEREWFAAAWVEITNNGGWSDEQYAFNVYGGDHEEEPWNRKAPWQMMHSWKEVSHYTAKYVAKVVTESLPETFGRPGRWWGVMGWEVVPVDEVVVQLSANPTAKVQRVLRKHCEAKVRQQAAAGVKVKRLGGVFVLDADLKLHRLQTPWVRPGRSCRFFGDPLEMWRVVLWAEGKPYPKSSPVPESPF